MGSSPAAWHLLLCVCECSCRQRWYTLCHGQQRLWQLQLQHLAILHPVIAVARLAKCYRKRDKNWMNMMNIYYIGDVNRDLNSMEWMRHRMYCS